MTFEEALAGHGFERAEQRESHVLYRGRPNRFATYSVHVYRNGTALFTWEFAIVDYLAQNKKPTMGFAGAEDVTQRKANPYVVRSSNSAAQCMYPLADYAFKDMKVKRAVVAKKYEPQIEALYES